VGCPQEMWYFPYITKIDSHGTSFDDLHLSGDVPLSWEIPAIYKKGLNVSEIK
jgi:hypothetical protein